MTPRPTLPPDFEQWLADHPNLASDDLAPPWHLAEGADPLRATPAPDPARIQAIQAALAQTAANGTNGTAPRPALRHIKPARVIRWMAAAAVVVALVATGLFFRQQPLTITAPDGGMASVDLPDGSQIQLAGGSTLTYGRRFEAETRRVQLNGEAFFDVAKAGTPFVIETFNATVTVLGTSFNVQAWPDAPEAETVVIVETGVVEVTARQTPETALRLAAGEAARVAALDADSTPQVFADPDAALAWRNGPFIFINQPLGVMFDEIEQRFGIKILAPETVRNHIHNFKQQVNTAEQLVSDLCQSVSAMHLRYRTTANGFEVFED